MTKKRRERECCRWVHKDKDTSFGCCLRCEKKYLYHAPPLHPDGTTYERGEVVTSPCDLHVASIRTQIPLLWLRGYKCRSCGRRTITAEGLYKPVVCPACKKGVDFAVVNIVAGPKVYEEARKHDAADIPRRRRGPQVSDDGPRTRHLVTLPDAEWVYLQSLGVAMGPPLKPSRAISELVRRDQARGGLSDTINSEGAHALTLSPAAYAYLQSLGAALDLEVRTGENVLGALAAVLTPEALAQMKHTSW